MSLLVVIAVVIIVVWAWKSTVRPSWCPPGPPLLPWVGNLFSITDIMTLEKVYTEWNKKYGDIIHVKAGVAQQVVLSDPALIRDAYSRAEVTGRPKSEFFDFVAKNMGLVSSQGELWQESRRFSLHHLRNLGMGKAGLEDFIHQQIAGFMEEVLTPGCGKEISIGASLNIAIVNIIWKLAVSEELKLTDTKILGFLKRLQDSLNFSENLAMADVAPWPLKLVPEIMYKKSQKERETMEMIKGHFGPTVRAHKEELSTSGEPKDFLEALLREQQKRPDLFTDWHVLMCIVDLFIAGNDTTATTLRWAFCFLCNHPEVQTRLQDELDEQIGRDRLPTAADRQKLPYMEAVMHETQRMADIAPALAPHETIAPVTIGGYTIPAGVQIIGNAYAVHRNEKLFPDPLEFKPERFLDKQGQFKPDKNVIPFSVGKRQCLGETLARTELFLFLASVLQKFSLRWPDGFRHDYSFDMEVSFIVNPAPYKLIPQKR